MAKIIAVNRSIINIQNAECNIKAYTLNAQDAARLLNQVESFKQAILQQTPTKERNRLNFNKVGDTDGKNTKDV